MEQFFILAMVLAFYTHESYTGNFRSPNGSTVSSGDSISEVMVKCDLPNTRIKRTDNEDTISGRIRYIDVEEWTYNEAPIPLFTI